MTVMNRTIVATMRRVLAEMDGMGSVVMSHEEGSSRVAFSAIGRDTVVIEWSDTDYHSAFRRVRGALKSAFLPHPQKTPFRPGRRRVRHFRLLPSVKVGRIVDLVWAETKSVPLTWSGT